LTVTEIVTPCDRDPLLAPAVTEYVPRDVELVVDIVNELVALPPELTTTVPELNEETTDEADTVEVSVIDPTKPERLVRVIVAIPEEPWTRVSETRFVETAKSGAGGCEVTENAIVTEWASVPFVPVTVAE